MSAHFSPDDLQSATGGHWLKPPSSRDIDLTISTDTRTIGPGQAYLPIVGERFDGHGFLQQAVAAGATIAVIQPERISELILANPPCALLAVEDTTLAYLALGRYHRRRMQAKIVALTGSSGKTTVKDMLLAAFSPLMPTQASLKNHNNDIGVSQTLLAIQPDTRLMIIEMGMRGRHQIDRLSLAAEPEVGLVVNVGPAHIGLLGSLENIARAKCELYDGLHPETGVAIANGDNEWLMREFARHPFTGRRMTFSRSQADAIALTPDATSITLEGVTLSVPMCGEHMADNLLAVAGVAKALEIPLAALKPGLAQFVPTEGRGDTLKVAGRPHLSVINDAYNANPASMKAALEALFAARSSHDEARDRLMLVISGMNELGEHAEHYHRELGGWLARQPGMAGLVLVGDQEAEWMAQEASKAAFPIQTVATVAAVPEALDALGLFDGTHPATLYLKGSRGFGLDRLPALLAVSDHRTFV